jgi:hypothetical protein
MPIRRETLLGFGYVVESRADDASAYRSVHRWRRGKLAGEWRRLSWVPWHDARDHFVSTVLPNLPEVVQALRETLAELRICASRATAPDLRVVRTAERALELVGETSPDTAA